MSTILHINASGTTEGSVTRAATDRLIADLDATTVITRDLAATPLPQVDHAWIHARLVPEDDKSADDKAILALSDELVAEIQAADIIVIGMPIYNFGMPAALKAWVDLMARPKLTFAYTETGPVGLLEGKRAVVAVASGGVPINSAMDFATPHMERILQFVGVTEIEVHAAADVIEQAA